MALVLNLKYVDNLDNRCDRIMKVNFRDFEKATKIVRGKDSIYFGEQFQWPMGRKLDPIDTLEMKLYQYSKYLNNKLIGTMTISLQKLLEESKISYKENLIDNNHSIIRITVSFDITYYSPDSQIADWRRDEFDNPVNERKLSDGDDISIDSHGLGSEKRGLIDTQTGEMGDVNYGQVENESMDSGEDDESMAATNVRALGVPLALNPTLHKTEDWQISITIIEARQLAGANINPLIEVRIGEKTKSTEVQMSTNSPYYNQYLCFEFHMSKAELFDQVIRIRCMGMGNMAISRLLPGDLIGEFRMDVRTVYNAQDHMFLHKWAMLVDPKDILSGAKGYVKVDLTIMGKGEQVKHKPKGQAKKPKDNDDEDIEANLLLPQTIKSGTKRQMAEICVKIYKAEDLPRMNTDIMATIKMAITGDSKPLVDPFVQVSFAGHTGKTKVKKNTYTPEWNEEIVFTEMFPTLCNRIRISVYDWDTVFNECIATHYIDLSQVMNEGDTGFLPTFGPSWVNLYGTPRNYTYDQMMRPKEELNRGLGEGVAYRGRLLIAIKTVLRSESVGLPAGAKVYSVPPISDGTCGKKEPFLLIGAFYEASVIDSEIGRKKQPIYLELSIGTTGNRLDSEGNEEEEKEFPSAVQGNRPKIPKWCHSTTDPMIPDTNDQEYFHLSFNERKPCLYMISYHEDHKSRHFIPNILEKLKNEFNNTVEIIHEFYINDKRGTYFRMKNALDTFAENVESSLNSIKCIRHVSPKTLLDKERIKLIKVCLEKMRLKAKSMYQDCNKTNLPIRLKECRAIIKKLNELIPNPQDGLPDIFIWLIQDNKRMAFARIPAREILYSAIPEEKGKKNSEVVTVFLQKPGRFGMGPSGWALQAQLKMYFWLGLLRDMKTFQQGLPLGYSSECFKFRRPPMEIIYTERSYFQLRAHMFMARNLIGSDESGLSDAFARILINDHVVTTKVVYETLSPKWDQTLIIDHMVFYYSKDLIFSNPPVLVVEMFDEDQMTGIRSNQKGKSEFLGRCFCKPAVALEEEEYKQPRLTWWEIYRGQMNAGELLAAFELIQVFPDEGYRLANGMPRIEQMVRSNSPIESMRSNSMFSQKETLLANMEGDVDTDLNVNEGVTVTAEGHFVVPVPKEIRPSLIPYRVEFLFWGVREMQRVQLMSVDKPRITIEFGSSHLISDVIFSCKIKPNFSNPLKYMDIMLPENLLYWPPLMIQCEDLRQFGRTILIGNHVISNVTKYVLKGKIPIEDDETTTTGNLSSVRKSSTNMNTNVQALLDNAKLLQDATQNSAVSQNSNLNNSKTNLSQTGILINSTDKLGKLDSQSLNDTKLKQIYPTTNTPPETPIHHPNYKDDKRPLVGNDSKSDSKLGVKIMKSIPEVTPTKPKDSTIEPVKGLGVVELKKKAKIPRDELQDIDWWSRYYVSIEDLDDEGLDDSSDSNIDVLKDIEVDVKSEDDQGGLAEIPEDDEDTSKKKKKKKRKKKKKKSKKDKKKDGDKGIFAKLPFGRVDAAKKYLEEKDDDDFEDEDNVKPDYHNLIERFKVYPSPLEDIKEFEGFAAFIQTFPLQKGRQEDEEESSDHRIVGNFKGNLKIYKVDDEEFGVEVDVHKLMLYKNLPNNDPVQILVRIYVIRANDLHPADPNGKSDPYLLIRLGNKVINEKENYIPKQLNPIFGKCFELDVKFPQESNLLIQVMDWDLVSGDDLIGETKIDLENRYYSKHKALCGLSQVFENHGYNKWRDIQLPTVMLAKLCKEYGFDPPKYEALVNKVTVADVAFYADAEIEEDNGEKKQSNEPLALEVMKNWFKIPNGCQLVTEHIETRPLFNSEKPGIQQGNLEMWLDMFPKELGAPPLPIDIAPRQPISYELRVIIWNTEDVILSDGGVLTDEKSSDIFVKGWMKGLGLDDQVTDVHYRSLSGEGNFNWRFIFNFDYIKAEDKIVYKIKDSPFAIDETEIKAPCKLYLQVWDADLVTSDDFLGGLELILSKIPRGAKSSQTCGLHQLSKDGTVSTISIFKNKRYRGWWPFTGENEDEPKELDVNGKVDAEFNLLSKDEAEACPVGLGREEPNALPSPNRPDSSFLNFMNPLKSLKYLICNKFKWFLIKALIISALLALVVLFIYNAPGYLAKRMLGA